MYFHTGIDSALDEKGRDSYGLTLESAATVAMAASADVSWFIR